MSANTSQYLFLPSWDIYEDLQKQVNDKESLTFKSKIDDALLMGTLIGVKEQRSDQLCLGEDKLLFTDHNISFLD